MRGTQRNWNYSLLALATLAAVVAPATPGSTDPTTPAAFSVWSDPHIDTIDGAPLTDDQVELFEYQEPTGSTTQAYENDVYTWEDKPEAETDPDYNTDIALVATTDVPDTVMEVTQTAFYELRKVIDFDTTGFMHTIEIAWSDELPANALGGTSTRWTSFTDNGTSYWEPAMLADTRAGSSSSSQPSMAITMNANIDWNLDTQPVQTAGDNRYVLKSVLMHEILHGLGIAPTTTTFVYLDASTRSTWERAMYSNQDLNQPWESQPSSFVQGNNLWLRNLDGTWERVYDPTTYAPGSSIGHLDENSYQNVPGVQVDSGALMTPFIYDGEVAGLDGVIAGLLDVVGWDVKVAPGTPSITSATAEGNDVRVVLTPNTSGTYAPAEQWTITATDSSNQLVGSTTVAATEREVVFDTGTAVPTRIAVTAVNGGGSSTPAEQWSVVDPNGSTTTTSTTTPTSTTTTPTTTAPTTTAPTTTTAPPATTPTTSPVRVGLSLSEAVTVDEIIQSRDYQSSDADTLRLYRAFFSREPDPAGVKYWLTEARQGVNYDEMAWAFSASTEFRETYGSVDNNEFLTIVYSNVLGRGSDPAGFAYWLGEVENGLSRHQVVRWVAASQEFSTEYPYEP